MKVAGGSGRPVRVAHLHSSLGVYGAERWTLTLLKYLDPGRCVASLVTIGSKPGADAFHRYAAAAGVDATHIDAPGKLSLAGIAALRRHLRDRGIDILHAHGFKSDVVGLLAAAGLPVTCVTTLHGWSADEGLRIRLYETIGRVALRRYARIYPLSPALARQMADLGFPSDRVRLILNAVDTRAFDAGYARRTQRAPGEAFRLVFVGRMCRPKGVADLIEATARARLEVPFDVTYLGDGPERGEFEALAERLGVAARSRFAGAVDDVSVHLDAAHGLVLPSYSEGIPRVVMEAMAAGVPVIGTDIPGIRQLVADGETGLLVPVADPDALARAIERLAAEPALAARMVRRARALIDERYSAARMARDFESEYEALAGAAAPGREDRSVNGGWA
jgi:glycosyltransferase involved in cell wall biosynthesis